MLKKPWASIATALVLIALVAAPAVTIRMQMSSASTLPPAAESRQGLDIVEHDFDRESLSPTSVLLTWEGDEDIDMGRAAGLFLYGQQVSQIPGVASVLSPFTLEGLSQEALAEGGLDDPTALAAFWSQFESLLNDPGGFEIPAEGLTVGRQTISAAQLEQVKQLVQASVAPGAVLYRVVSETPPDSAESRAIVEELLAAGPPAGFEVHVAGETASSYDFFKELGDWFPWVVAWVVVTSFLVFVFLLRSLLLPLLAVAVNLLTIAMSYGWLVLVFQNDTFEGLLRFTSTGGIDAIIPVVLLCVLFGITMDYAVFMLTRMQERWARTGDNREAVTVGIVRTGRIILSAALLVVIVTGAFAFTSIAETKMLGLGIALAIIVDVLFVRMTLLPALMVYFGKANWWWPLHVRGKQGEPGVAAQERGRPPQRSRGTAGRPRPGTVD